VPPSPPARTQTPPLCARSSLTGALFLFVIGGLINIHYPYIHIPGDTGVLSQQVRMGASGAHSALSLPRRGLLTRARARARALSLPLPQCLLPEAPRAQTVYAGLLYLACAGYSLYYWLAGARRQGYMAVPARSH